MSQRIKNYFGRFADDMPKGNIHNIIALHENPGYEWEDIQKLSPGLCRGWFELSKLNKKDRIDFLSEFWMSKLPYRQGVSEFLGSFLQNLDDVGIFITQQIFEGPREAQIIYCLKEDNGFYTGYPPASENQIQALSKQFPDWILPHDFLAFLQIHDGFSKTTDSTGIIPSGKMHEYYRQFQEMLANNEIINTMAGTDVNPSTLIPFYKSFGMPFFQCFWTEWYPEEEMGNVYYSGQNKMIMINENEGPSEDSMAFPTFMDWLKFYLERIG